MLAGTRAAIAAATGVSLLLLPACSHAAGPARVRCTLGTQAYSRLQYVFVGGSPLPAVPAGTKYSNYIAAPDRSVPPADQTIGLTC